MICVDEFSCTFFSHMYLYDSIFDWLIIVIIIIIIIIIIIM